MPKILILEDSPIDQRMLKGVLAKLYDLEFVSDSTSFFAAARNSTPDLILLDVVLPDASGFAVFEKLQRDPTLNQVPVFFVSGRSSPLDRVTGLSLSR